MSALLDFAVSVAGGIAALAAWAQTKGRRAERSRFEDAVKALQEQQAENAELSAQVRDLTEANDTFGKVDEERDAAVKELRAIKRAAKAAGVKLAKPKRRAAMAQSAPRSGR